MLFARKLVGTGTSSGPAGPISGMVSSVAAQLNRTCLWPDRASGVSGLPYSLANNSFADVSSWAFGDAVFSWNYDFFADGSKARRLGFPEHIDTTAMFLSVFSDLRERKIIN